MNNKRWFGGRSDIVASTHSVSRDAAQKSLRERSREELLIGWIISMIGIVTYCFAMFNGDQQADLPDALNAHGAIGWVAVIIILIGVRSWFVGCIGMLNAGLNSESGDR